MATNMQRNSYFPGYYASGMGNLNLDANESTWPSDCHNKIFESGNYYNDFLSSDSLLAYNKDLMKQTMLTHETIFKDQIQELHRLYRRQRELMDEIRRNELNNHCLRFEASHSNMPFFQTSCEYEQKTFQVPGYPLINPAGSQVQSPLSSARGKNVQVCHSYPTKSQANPRDFQLSDPKCKKFGKKLLDLQLPADEYIDSEDKDLLDDEKVSEMPEVSSCSVKRSSQVVYTSDVKSFFGSNALNSVFLGPFATPPSILEKQEWSAELNELGKLKEQPASLSNGIVGPLSGNKLLCSEPSEKEKLDFQHSLEESVQSALRRPNVEVSPNFLQSETGRTQEQQSYHDKAGKLGSNLDSFLHGFNKDLEHVCKPPTFHQGNQSLLLERTIYGAESLRRNCALSNDGQYGSRASFHGSTFDIRGSWTNMENTGRSPIAVQALPCESGRNPIAVQALPCLNTSVQLAKTYKSSIGKPELGGGSKLVPNSHGFKFLSSNDVNLNSKPPGCSSEFAVSQGVQMQSGVEKHEYSRGGLSWLRVKPAHNGKDNIGHGILMETVSVEPKKVETNDSSSKKCPGFHDLSESDFSGHHCSSSSSPHKACQSPLKDVKSDRKDWVIDLNLAFDAASEMEMELTADEHVVENGVDRKHMGFGCLIDLNSSMSGAAFTEKPSLAAEIDLAAPLSPENKESSPPRGESDENQAEIPLLLSGQEDVDQHDELTKIAAEAIVSFSSSSKSPTSLPDTTFEPLEVSLHDSLHWFAGIVSSATSNPAASELGLVSSDDNNDNNCEELLPDEMDYFEVMTLKLTETKHDKCCYKSSISKEEETGTSSSPSQQRKGRTRCGGGRQQKDFQREILPSLASLSRYEVTEDLQTIGGLMEAAGAHWETGSKRYAARNGYSRARKRPSMAGASGVGCSVESLLKQISRSSSSSNSKAGKEERSVICWGKVTRRRRGQRCPVRISNQQLILSQV